MICLNKDREFQEVNSDAAILSPTGDIALRHSERDYEWIEALLVQLSKLKEASL